MSAAEFVIAASAAVLCLTAAHELARLQLVRNSINLVAASAASRHSYQSLKHVLHGSFSPDVGHTRTRYERQIERSVLHALDDPLLRWSWAYPSENSPPSRGIRVSLNGSKFGDLEQPTSVRIHVCLRSWLEPIVNALADGRNCLGEFSTHSELGQTRGIAISVSASRAKNISLDSYFRGESAEGNTP